MTHVTKEMVPRRREEERTVPRIAIESKVGGTEDEIAIGVHHYQMQKHGPLSPWRINRKPWSPYEGLSGNGKAVPSENIGPRAV